MAAKRIRSPVSGQALRFLGYAAADVRPRAPATKGLSVRPLPQLKNLNAAVTGFVWNMRRETHRHQKAQRHCFAPAQPDWTL